jgi:hypothetical protein
MAARLSSTSTILTASRSSSSSCSSGSGRRLPATSARRRAAVGVLAGRRPGSAHRRRRRATGPSHSPRSSTSFRAPKPFVVTRRTACSRASCSSPLDRATRSAGPRSAPRCDDRRAGLPGCRREPASTRCCGVFPD